MSKANLVAESEVLDPRALAAYASPVREAPIAAGGKPAVISSIGGRIMPVMGTPILNMVISEWDSVANALAWLNSPQLKAMEPLRGKAYRILRQFIVETANP